MQIVILGSGIIGTTSAYYLAKQGHSVTVVDRQPAAAMETSFANAGQISPGYSAPWAAPGIPVKAIKWMLSKHSPLVVSPKPEWSKIKFIGRMLANCNARSYAINKGRMLRLAEYSRVSLQQLQQELKLDYDGESKGTLQVFRTEKQLKAAAKDIALLEEYGVPYELLDADGCVNVEPGLAAVKHKIVGGLRLVLDQTGDCFKLSTGLVESCKQMGVEFKFDTQIKSLNMQHNKIASVTTDKGDLTADKFVMALGSYSTELLKQVGIDSPVYPVKGYSITIPVTNEGAAPVSTIMDETYKVALTRLGDRIRVAGTAELNGYDLGLSEKRGDTIRHVVSDLFPEGTDLSEDNLWTGLRPMTPDGTPIIGATDVSNLFLNTGHGTLGWTMSFGSGRLLADIISGVQTDIECEDLSIRRYSRTFSLNNEPDKALVTR
jgi:D-amino-acid dehydrogenase